MNIDNVISFIYVYRFRSFSKASEALYITQPALTSRIKSLEKNLDTALFIRNKAGVTLTEKGKIFLPYAFQLFEIYIKAQNCLRQTEENITVGSIISASTAILPNALHQFQQRNPLYSINVITAKTTTMLERLLNNECQIAITEKIEHEGIICECIIEDPIFLFANPSHYFFNRHSPITLEEVSLEPLICFNPTSQYWNSIEKHFVERNLTPNICFVIDSIEAAKEMIAKGYGICFLPKLSLETALTAGQVRRVFTDPRMDINREIALIYPKESTASYLQELAYNIRCAIKLHILPLGE